MEVVNVTQCVSATTYLFRRGTRHAAAALGRGTGGGDDAARNSVCGAELPVACIPAALPRPSIFCAYHRPLAALAGGLSIEHQQDKNTNKQTGQTTT